MSAVGSLSPFYILFSFSLPSTSLYAATRNRNRVSASSSISCSAAIQERDLGRKLTPDEAFLYLHTKAHDGVNFINDHCKEIQDKYANPTEAEVARNAEQLVCTIDELRVYYEAVGGINKDGQIFGLGSAASEYYRDRYPRSLMASSSSSFIGASTSGADSEIIEIRTSLETVQERLDGFNADRTGFIAHLQEVNDNNE